MARFSFVLLLVITLFLLRVIYTRFSNWTALEKIKQQTGARRVIAFFHPFCDAGGGGEKVLFQALHALQIGHKMEKSLSFKNCKIVIYSGSSKTPKEILRQVRNRFSIECDEVEFIQLKTSETMHAQNYPSFTLLWQMIAYTRVCFEALQAYPCDVFIDTIGVACAYAAIKLYYSPKIVSYTHYPMISTDMLKQIGQGAQFNNSEQVERSWFYRNVKRVYYHFLMFTYKFCGRYADQVATNSSWTNDHILELWQRPKITTKIFPPCDTSEVSNLLGRAKRENIMVSFAQFRPEKDHAL
jgi:alpha-1,2-mannosyltransferase